MDQLTQAKKIGNRENFAHGGEESEMGDGKCSILLAWVNV